MATSDKSRKCKLNRNWEKGKQKEREKEERINDHWMDNLPTKMFYSENEDDQSSLTIALMNKTWLNDSKDLY